MKNLNLPKISGKDVKSFVDWLIEIDMGCCHFHVYDTDEMALSICVGWHDYGDCFRIAWKIGMQTHNNIMQCDFDVDFDMPYNRETGDVYDTLDEIIPSEIKTMKEWNQIASRMNKAAKDVVLFEIKEEEIAQSKEN